MFVGIAGGVIFSSFTFLPERWFPAAERGIATALAVQSTNFGWGLGTLIPAVLGDDPSPAEFKTFLLWQVGAV